MVRGSAMNLVGLILELHILENNLYYIGSTIIISHVCMSIEIISPSGQKI